MGQPVTTDHRSRGLALIAVLWLSVMLAMIATAALRLSRTDVVLASNVASGFAAEQAVQSAIATALYTYLTGEDEDWFADGTPYGWSIEGIEVRVAITDETWRVDPNTASEAALTDMFTSLGEGDSVAAARAAEIVAYREAAREALGRTATAAQLQQEGFFAFGLVDEVRMATAMDEGLARRVAEVATVHTGLETPRGRPRRVSGPLSEGVTLTDSPQPLEALAETPPERSTVLRLQAEARTAEGALAARELVVDLDGPGRPYTTRLLRRSEQELFEPGE